MPLTVYVDRGRFLWRNSISGERYCAVIRLGGIPSWADKTIRLAAGTGPGKLMG
jgi:hypothetical protein